MPLRRDRKATASSSSKFLFVNEDAATINRLGKDAELDREKQSHVQRQNFAKRRLQKDKAQATSNLSGLNIDQSEQSLPRTSHVTPAAPFTGRFPNLSVDLSEARIPQGAYATAWQAELDRPSIPFDLRTYAANDSVQQNSLALELDPRTPSASLEAIQTQLTQSATRTALSNPLRSSLSHPLLSESGPVPLLSEWAPSLMQYYTTVLLREIFYHDTRLLPLSRLRHAPAIHAEMNDAMSHPAHLYSLLASVSIQMLRREGRLLSTASDSAAEGVPEAHYMRIILFFKTRAIESLRAALDSGPVTHKLVADVQRLMLVAYFSDTHEAALPHFEAMKSMIGFLGGLSTFSDYFIETKILMHWAANLSRLTNPQVCMAWDPGAGPEDIRFITTLLRRTAKGHSARGFASLVTAGILSPRIRDLAADMADVLRFERYIDAHAQNTPHLNPVSDPGHFKWAFRRHIAVGYHLLALDPDTDFAKYDARNEAIRIAMIYFVALTRSPNRGQRCGSKTVYRLREALFSERQLLKERWRPHTSALLWVAVIGSLTARPHTAEQDWLVDLSSECAIELGIKSIEDLEEMLGEYLYDPELQRGKLFNLWAKMRNRGVGIVSSAGAVAALAATS